MRVSDALSLYRESRLLGQRRGGPTYRSLRLLLEPVLKAELASVSRDGLTTLLQQFGAHAPVHAQRALGYAAPFFSWAVEAQLISDSPAAHIERPRPPPPRDRLLALKEVRQVWEAAATLAYPFGPAIQLLMLTAAFRDDIAALRLSELSRDVASNWNWRPAGRMMGEGQLGIPLPPAAAQVLENSLRSRRPGSDLVFSTTGATPISGWSKAKKRLDDVIAGRGGGSTSVPPWRLNDLRASFAAISRDVLGTNPMVVERCLGRISGISNPVGREWAASEDINDQHREALHRWATAVTRPGGKPASDAHLLRKG